MLFIMAASSLVVLPLFGRVLLLVLTLVLLRPLA